MPFSRPALEKLANFLGDLAHPHRLRLIRELSTAELDVTKMQELLGISQPAVSQHLGILKSHNILEQRREGHHIYYKLENIDFVNWLMGSFEFIENELAANDKYRESLAAVQSKWLKNKKKA